ncbi:MAG TPA: hypothetical protein VFD03_07440, partial [Clostridia bacterium]|nr:hypothetical protein [Clostridia bacterium]
FRYNQKVIVSEDIERKGFLKNENKNENEDTMDLLKVLSSLSLLSARMRKVACIASTLVSIII